MRKRIVILHILPDTWKEDNELAITIIIGIVIRSIGIAMMAQLCVADCTASVLSSQTKYGLVADDCAKSIEM